jgi:kelch-like protein 2/3
MQTARTAVGAASLNGLVLAVGGECALAEPQDETMYLRCVEAYDPLRQQWRTLADMKVARSFVSVCVAGGHLYALGLFVSCSLSSFVFSVFVGGEDRATTFNLVEKYDYKSDTWSFVPSMQRKRAGTGVAVCDGKIYVAGKYYFQYLGVSLYFVLFMEDIMLVYDLSFC